MGAKADPVSQAGRLPDQADEAEWADTEAREEPVERRMAAASATRAAAAFICRVACLTETPSAAGAGALPVLEPRVDCLAWAVVAGMAEAGVSVGTVMLPTALGISAEAPEDYLDLARMPLQAETEGLAEREPAGARGVLPAAAASTTMGTQPSPVPPSPMLTWAAAREAGVLGAARVVPGEPADPDITGEAAPVEAAETGGPAPTAVAVVPAVMGGTAVAGATGATAGPGVSVERRQPAATDWAAGSSATPSSP